MTRVLIVTCATGGPKFVEMTKAMLRSLKKSIASLPDTLSVVVSIVEQALDGCTNLPVILTQTAHTNVVRQSTNDGFAAGMNKAVLASGDLDQWTWVVTLNNDCLFPDTLWLSELVGKNPTSTSGSRNLAVRVPLNTRCNTPAMVSSSPKDRPAFRLPFCPAVCWAIPGLWVQELMRTQGWPLFDPEFKTGWAEDNWTGFVLRQMFGATPFTVVPKSWIHHIGSQTVNEEVRKRGAGWTEENMRLLRRKSESYSKRRKG